MVLRLKICLPDRVLSEESADKVILPIDEGTLTVIHDRAPTSQLLTFGAVQLLDNLNRPSKHWFINGGIADIANDKCIIAVEQAVDLSSISLKEAEEKAKESVFYQNLCNYLKAFG